MKVNTIMFLRFKNKRCDLFSQNGAIIRRFNAKSNITSAILNGDGKTATIAITDSNGKVTLYNTQGHIIRKK